MKTGAIQKLDSAISRIDRELSRGRPKRFSREELQAIRQALADARAVFETSDSRQGALQVVNLAVCLSRLMEVAEHFLSHLK